MSVGANNTEDAATILRWAVAELANLHTHVTRVEWQVKNALELLSPEPAPPASPSAPNSPYSDKSPLSSRCIR